MKHLKQAFLFQSHLSTSHILREYEKIREAIKDIGDMFFLYHDNSYASLHQPQANEVYRVTDENLASIHYPMIGKQLIPGHAHFPLLLFFREKSGYDFYWIIEYDVRFSGNWRHLFDAFQDIDADLLASHIRAYTDEPDWPWWALDHPLKSIPVSERLRSFNPVYRMSGASLSFLHNELLDGWRGHQEVVIPTLLHNGGFKIMDFGERGKYTPHGMEDRFYTGSESNRDGSLTSGTMRYRPFFWKTGKMKDKLYHPVKPLSFIVREKTFFLRALYRRLLTKLFPT